ncbi:MAG: WG repeat-containing protein [Duncaniella sp.]|nr:WG repeat-containing protein [Duncaniella sp.]
MKRDKQNINLDDELLDNISTDIHDESLPHSLRRTVWLIQDEEDSETYTADEILDDKPQDIIINIRQALYASYKSGEYKYVCKHCQQPLGLKVRTHGGDFFPFFSHFQNGGECYLKDRFDIDPTQSVREYENAFQKSLLYQQMVARLKEVLERIPSFTNIIENKLISKPEIKGYRTPAIYSHFNNIGICFDLLVSNPMLSLLVGRNAFYKLHKLFYLWLFPSFTPRNQSLCQKDILYMNRRNVFVFDCKDYYNQENKPFCEQNLNPSTHLYAYEESIRQNKLLLNCYWQTPEVRYINGKTQISIKWNGPELVSFEDLNFDLNSFELYYHDSDIDFYNSYPIEIQRQIDEWLKIKKDRWVKIFDSIEKRKILYAQSMANIERKERLKYYYSLAESDEAVIQVRYDENTKLFGYTVEGFDIIAPIYYDAKPFFYGYAWVRKKERWGVIDIRNRRIVSFQYSQLHELENGLFYAYKNKKYVLVDYKGEQKGNVTFDYIEKIKDGMYKIGNDVITGYDRGYLIGSGFYNYKNTKTEWGIINGRGEEILPCKMDSIDDFENGRAKVTFGNKIGYIDEEGHEEYELEEREIVKVYKSPLLSKLGLMDDKKNILTPPIYDYIGEFFHGLAIVKIHKSIWSDKYGIIDVLGHRVTGNVDYNKVIVFYNGTYATQNDGKYTIKKICDDSFLQEFDDIGVYDENYIVVKRNGKWGIIDYNGIVIISIKYGEIIEFNKDTVRVKMHIQDSCAAEIDWMGNEIYPIYQDNSAWIYESRLNKRYGMMDENHQPITGLEYSRIEYLYGNCFKALKENKWGIMDRSGKILLSFEYDSVFHISHGYSKIAKGQLWNQKWGVLNPNGQIIIPTECCEIVEINSKIIKVRKEKNGKIALFNIKGEEIYHYRKYSDVIIYGSIFINKFGLMNHDKIKTTDLIFDSVSEFKDGKAKAKKDGYWGIINTLGETLIPFKFSKIGDFVNGVAPAEIYGEGYIDECGNEIYSYHNLDDMIIKESRLFNKFGIMSVDRTPITELIYGCMPKFFNDQAIVNINNKWGVINKKGAIIVPFDYDELIITQRYTFIARIKRKYGIIDVSGSILTPFRFNRIIEKGVGLYCIREETYGCWGIINDNNDIILPVKYDAIGDIESGIVNVKKGRWWKKVQINMSDRKKYVSSNNIIDLSKLENDVLYDALSTGINKIGIFIKIQDIGSGLIPAKEILTKNRKLGEFKAGVSFKVKLLKKDMEKGRATFKLAD